MTLQLLLRRCRRLHRRCCLRSWTDRGLTLDIRCLLSIPVPVSVSVPATHFYPSSGDHTSFKPCAGGDDWDPGCFAQQMALTRAAIPKEKGFLLTEYNAGCCMKYYQHDDSGAAAFAFRSVGDLAGITDVLSW